MGTSKRRTDDKIRKLLKERKKEDVVQAIPEVAIEILTRRKINSYFSEKEFEVVLACGIRGIKSILTGNFNEEFSYEGKIDSDIITIQNVIEAILQVIDGEEVHSDLLIRALKYAGTIAIKENNNDKILIFINEFCYHLLYLLVSESIIEALSDEYSDSPTSKIDDAVKKLSRKIVEKNLLALISDFVSGNAALDSLITSIIESASNVKIGDL